MDTQSYPNEVQPQKQEPRSNSLIRDILDYIQIFVVAVCIVVTLFSFSGFRLCTVSGPSMENTLLDGEKLITSNLFYTAKRGDVIVFHQTSDKNQNLNEPIVKRVIGVAGDTVCINHQTGEVKIKDRDGNETVLEEPYCKPENNVVNTSGSFATYTEVYVEEGTVFVMGDNRNRSLDSRNSAIGLVDTRRILGKVVLRVTPFERFGPVA